jgi:hypothetical protein
VFPITQLHPFSLQAPIVDYCVSKGILMQAYCPVIRGDFSDPVLQEISKKVSSSLLRYCHQLEPHALNSNYQVNKAPPQVLVRWSLQRGYDSPPPKLLSMFDVDHLLLASCPCPSLPIRSASRQTQTCTTLSSQKRT